MRFQDSLFTDSTGAQTAPVQQPYPGDVGYLDQTYTGSVAQSAAVGGGSVPRPQDDVRTAAVAAAAPAYGTLPPAPQPAAAALQPVTAGPALAPVARASLDATVTGSTAPAAPALQPPPVQAAQPLPTVAAGSQAGWTRAGGTQVTIREGETVYNLSRRFGVPVEAIQRANGLSADGALAVGQQIVIPTYVHSANAPVSAPDANPNVADARSSTGTRYDIPADKVPVPGQAPADRVAVLPQQPKLEEQDSGAQTAATDPQRGPGSTAGGTYTVAAGDTLSAISRKTGVSTEALKQANGLSSGLIRIGQTLTIPAGGAVPAPTQVAAAPAVDKTATGTVEAQPAAYTPPQATEKVIQQAALDTSAAPDASGISRMRWPARGRVISGFGESAAGRKNDGIDIAVPTGTAIRAAENGVVIYAGDGLKEFGNTVLVRHEDGLVTVYGHASEINVQRGQKVRRGDEIAKAGMSGSADTPKLHFEVRKDSTPVNPAAYLE